ncbi:MAG: hypothetical protein CMK89_02105 [Pseudomonadales bacterium]|nr:hypothetical protein [Pseudomonadales bacterium]RLU00092.1 MAG: hypothetical protein D9N11_12945 [Ketobacter sp.]
MFRPLILSAALISSFVFAGSPSAVDIARENLARSVTALAEKETECSKSATILPAEAISKLGLDDEQLKTAISYFYMKSSLDCSYPEAANVIVNLRVLHELQPDMPKEDGGKLITSSMVRLLEEQAKYEQLPEGVRQQLEGIKALHAPFKMIESAQALGL